MSVLEISGIILTRVRISNLSSLYKYGLEVKATDVSFSIMQIFEALQSGVSVESRLTPASRCQVKLVEQGVGYLVLSGLMTAALALLPFAFRLAQHLDVSGLGSLSPAELLETAVGPPDVLAYAFFFNATVQRICLAGLFFFMMCVAERTYKQVSVCIIHSVNTTNE